ncbi:MAG TPA: hypothetical protein VFA48_08410, partial [Gammaproteobacteria bacterium]|nr:hypothetical protein [Gammaproteobacteria bacterium]
RVEIACDLGPAITSEIAAKTQRVFPHADMPVRGTLIYLALLTKILVILVIEIASLTKATFQPIPAVRPPIPCRSL